MWDLAMRLSLTSVVIDNPDMLSLLVTMFVTVVGLAAALVILKIIQLKKRNHVLVDCGCPVSR
jgi:hypothetical protein